MHGLIKSLIFGFAMMALIASAQAQTLKYGHYKVFKGTCCSKMEVISSNESLLIIHYNGKECNQGLGQYRCQAGICEAYSQIDESKTTIAVQSSSAFDMISEDGDVCKFQRK